MSTLSCIVGDSMGYSLKYDINFQPVYQHIWHELPFLEGEKDSNCIFPCVILKYCRKDWM